MKDYQYRRRGFTLFEVSVALSIGITALLAFTPYYLKIMERGLIEQTAYRAKMVYEGAINYYIDNNQWPTDTAALSSGNYIIGRAAQTSWGEDISVDVIADNKLALTFTAHKVGIANSIAAKLPTASVDSNLLITEVILPPMANAAFATKADLNLLQDLAGTRAWTGNYDAGGNDLINVRNIKGSENSRVEAGFLKPLRKISNTDRSCNDAPYLQGAIAFIDETTKNFTEHWNSPVYCTSQWDPVNKKEHYVWKRVGGLGCKVCIACSEGSQWHNVACDEADDDGWAISHQNHCDEGNIAIKFVCGPDSFEKQFPTATWENDKGEHKQVTTPPNIAYKYYNDPKKK
jgi:prepilin-type N-terminal cleavage/methylation domain-containing protein